MIIFLLFLLNSFESDVTTVRTRYALGKACQIRGWPLINWLLLLLLLLRYQICSLYFRSLKNIRGGRHSLQDNREVIIIMATLGQWRTLVVHDGVLRYISSCSCRASQFEILNVGGCTKMLIDSGAFRCFSLQMLCLVQSLRGRQITVVEIDIHRSEDIGKLFLCQGSRL